MQRNEPDGSVMISCDFCGTDWDQVLTMIEGHHGSVLCNACFKIAMEALRQLESRYTCTLCLREGLPAELAAWFPNPRPPGANPHAIVCEDCLKQAANTFRRNQKSQV